MKLSLVSAILLIQGIAANPLFKSKAKHSKGDRVKYSAPRNCLVHQALITYYSSFRIHLSKGFRVNQKLPLISKSREAMHSKSPTDCWAACFAEDPDCPETMVG